jgi:alpha-ketoglutarate-dependent taurine dioxygenase
LSDVIERSALGVDAPAPSLLSFRSIPGAAFGVEVNGVEWRRPDNDTVRLLTVALRRHLLLVLRGQRSPSETELDDFLRGFGRLVLETDDGAAHYRGHLNLGGPASEMAQASTQYMSRATDNSGSTHYTPGADGIAELVWHNDQSHRPMLKVLSVFEALDVEDGVVPTEYRDHYTAYETLPADLRGALEHRQVAFFDPRLPGPDEMPRLADATHPVFTPHPHTGRRALYVNDFTDRIVGMSRAESDETLALLRRHIESHAPRYAHQWRSGDLVMWDNVGLQHRRDAVPPNQRRHMRQHGGVAE